MIITVDGRNHKQHNALVDEMFCLRKRVFHDQLGWEVPLKDGREIDPYDDLDPVYVISVDDATGRVRGSLRMMPTTGPHLMRDVFSAWFDKPVVFESAAIWEVTRFCVDPLWLRGHYTPRGQNLVTCELIIAGCEVSARSGVNQLTTLSHMGMINAMRRIKCPHEIVATSDFPSTGKVHLGLWDVSDEIAMKLRAFTGLVEEATTFEPMRKAA